MSQEITITDFIAAAEQLQAQHGFTIQEIIEILEENLDQQ